MSDPKIDMTGVRTPTLDGEINEYAYKEAVDSQSFDRHRKVIFVNGMKNSGADHAESALALSWTQMCTVIGVYNLSVSGWKDFTQCIGDKNQFNGPASFSARTRVAVSTMTSGRTSVEAARLALTRNPAQVALFDLLRRPENRTREIFAHSQGNLILSNALQAIEAVDGAAGLAGRTVHTFGSPAVTWPSGIVKYEHAFSLDPVTFLAGFDETWTISKVGWPSGARNPITHAFLEYLRMDPTFLVNRFRVGGLGVTFNMDEDGLADALAAMGGNLRRVQAIFEHLDRNHNSDADDVAVRYVNRVKLNAGTRVALKSERGLVTLLIKIMSEGWTSSEEKAAIAFLQGL